MMTVRLSATYQVLQSEMEVPAPLARGLRRADDFIRLAVTGGFNCLQEVEKRQVAAERCGMILGTGFGTMQTNFDVLDLIVSGEQTSPTLFSHSVFNAAAGYMATLCDLRGCALTVTDFSLSFFRALSEGWLAIRSGWLDRCLVLQVETYSELLYDARRRNVAPEVEVWPAGVVCWLLENEQVTGAIGDRGLSAVAIVDEEYSPQDLLQPTGTIEVNGSTSSVQTQFGAAMQMTSLLASCSEPNVQGNVRFSGCAARLSFCR